MKDKNSNNKVLIRESNYELMRIISMFFIVIYHILLHGKIFEHSSNSMSLLVGLIEAIILVHVNSFILLTGYFQCKSKMKLGRVISIINETWFYKVIVMLVMFLLGYIYLPSKIELLHTLSPIDYGIYWYIDCYIVLYLISPILNKIINNSNQKQLKSIILTLFIIISILSTITKDVFFNSNAGRSVSTFVLLYLIGGYLRNYPLGESYHLKQFTLSAKKVIYISLFFICVTLSFLFNIAYGQFIKLGPLTSEIGTILGYFHISFASPIVIIQTVFYFLFFGTLTIKSKFINKVASASLGVYLISENIYIREFLYEKIKLTKVQIVTPKLLLYVFLLGIIIYIICTIIEILRKKIFTFIYNTKLAKKNRKFYQEYVKRLGININW